MTTETPQSRANSFFSGLAPNVRGALWMLASALTYSIMTTLIKYLGSDYSASLQMFYRQLASFVILLPLIVRRGSAVYATTRPGLLTLRSALAVAGLTMTFYAFQKMPLADANALSFTRTLWMVPLAAFVLREKVGPLRVAAAAIGFIGVLMMIRPGAGGHFAIGLPALAALGGSLLTAFTITGMKVMTRDHAPIVLLVWSASLGVLFSLPGAILAWAWPTPRDLLLLSLMGAIGTANQAFYIKGMQVGDAAAMAPIDYSRLVFSVIIGFALFHEIPAAWTMAGAAVVVASTLFISWREQQAVKAARERLSAERAAAALVAD